MFENCKLIPFKENDLIGFKDIHNNIKVEPIYKDIKKVNEATIFGTTATDEVKLISYYYSYSRCDNKIIEVNDDIFYYFSYDNNFYVFKNDSLLKVFRAEDGYIELDIRCSNRYWVAKLRGECHNQYEIYDLNCNLLIGKDYDISKVNCYSTYIKAQNSNNIEKFIVFNNHVVKTARNSKITSDNDIICILSKSGNLRMLDYITAKEIYNSNVKVENDDVELRSYDVDAFTKILKINRLAYLYETLTNKITLIADNVLHINVFTNNVINITDYKYHTDKLYNISTGCYSSAFDYIEYMKQNNDIFASYKNKDCILDMNTFEKISDEYNSIFCGNDTYNYIYITELNGKMGAISKKTKKKVLNNIYTKIYRADVGKSDYNELIYTINQNDYHGVYNGRLEKIVAPVEYKRFCNGMFGKYIQAVKDVYDTTLGKEVEYSCIYDTNDDSQVPVLPLGRYDSIEALECGYIKVTQDNKTGVFNLYTKEWTVELTSTLEVSVDIENRLLNIVTGSNNKSIALG